MASSSSCTPGANNFLYCPEVGKEAEYYEYQEKSISGRKRKLNPKNWGKKREEARAEKKKNSLLVTITDQMECCRKKCLQNI